MQRRAYRITIQTTDDRGESHPTQYAVSQVVSAEMIERALAAGHSLTAALRDSANYAIDQLIRKVEDDAKSQ